MAEHLDGLWLTKIAIKQVSPAALSSTRAGRPRGNCQRVVAYLRPRRCHQDHDAEPQVSEVMLVPQVLVCRDQHVVAMQNGRRKQVAILELAPPLFEDSVDLVAHQMLAKSHRCTLIKENLHADI